VRLITCNDRHLVTHEIRNGSNERYEKRILLRSRLCAPVTHGISDYVQPIGQARSSTPSKSSATISASSVGETDIQTPSKYVHKSGLLSWIVSSWKQTCCLHCAPGKRRVHQMVQGEAFPDRLFSHRRYNLYRLKIEASHPFNVVLYDMI
jgi:hypothetical protein